MERKSAQSLQPFSLVYSPQLPELFLSLNCSLAITTYQAGKLIFLSPDGPEKLIQLPRNFSKPMGLGLSEDGLQLALAVKEEVMVFSNSPELAHHYPRKPATYDAMFMPRLSYYTNALDIHDLDWVGGDLDLSNWVVSQGNPIVYFENTELSSVQDHRLSGVDLKIFPSPASEVVSVSIQGPEVSGKYSAKVLDMQGRVIYLEEQVSDQLEINCGAWPTGNYKFLVFNERGWLAESFVVVR